MKTLEILQDVINGITDFPREQIQPDTKLTNLNIDSMERIEIAIEIEECLDISVDDEALANFETLQDFMDHIEQQPKAQT